MPYVNVWIDPEDYLEDISTEELKKELIRRSSKHIKGSHIGDHVIEPGEAADTLRRASDYLRRCERFDFAHRLEEIRVDYVEGHKA